MIKVRTSDLSDAMQAFMLANTPLFIVRKLKADPYVAYIATRYGSERIIASLMESLSTKPKTLKQAVLPYVFLIALMIKQDVKALEVATYLDGQHHDWYNYIASVVLQMTPSITLTNINANSHPPTVQKSNPGHSYSYSTVTAASL